MLPDSEIIERGLLIVTGSALRAEQADRPLAYRLKEAVENHKQDHDYRPQVLVLSDLWYLNAEMLRPLPMISVGGPGVNAVSAHLYKKLTNALVIDNVLVIQMDLYLRDLRACIWGMDNKKTVNALDIFIENGYLNRFLEAVAARSC